MIIRVILIIMIVIACFMYAVILGASKCKTESERIMEDQEQTKAVGSDEYDRLNKEKRYFLSRFRNNSRK